MLLLFQLLFILLLLLLLLLGTFRFPPWEDGQTSVLAKQNPQTYNPNDSKNDRQGDVRL
jgi:hypothetical protein